MTVAFDFDGVIHKYSKGWQDGSIYDEISEEWFKLVRSLNNMGHTVFIMTTRPKRQVFLELKKRFYKRNYVTQWFKFIGFRVMPFWEKFVKRKINNCYERIPLIGICNHKAIFHVLIDDRTICFKGGWTNLKRQILDFQPWTEDKEEY